MAHKTVGAAGEDGWQGVRLGTSLDRVRPFENLLAMAGNKLDLECAWPQFAGDKETLSVGIVGDSVEHSAGFEAIDRAE